MVSHGESVWRSGLGTGPFTVDSGGGAADRPSLSSYNSGSASSANTFVPGNHHQYGDNDDAAGFSSSVGSYFHHPAPSHSHSHSHSSSTVPSPVLSPASVSVPHSRQASYTSLSRLSTSASTSNVNLNKPYSRSPPSTSSFAFRRHQTQSSLGHVAESLSQLDPQGSLQRAGSDRVTNGSQTSGGARFDLGTINMPPPAFTNSPLVASPPTAESPFSPLPFSDTSGEDESAASMAAQDPLATQMWKYFVRQKNQPHAQRMENLSWRMGGMRLRTTYDQAPSDNKPVKTEQEDGGMRRCQQRPDIKNAQEEPRGRERTVKSAGATPESVTSPQNEDDHL
jgi:hypothetical protein